MKKTLCIFNNHCKKIISALLVLSVLMITLVSVIPVSAAVSYKGSGTKKDPYIVETPEQLDGMRNNLSASYKLGANVDMKGYKSADPSPKKNFDGGFVPIGTHGEPFKGTFTCDIGAEGKPLYTIKNLSVTNNAGKIYGHKVHYAAGYSDYVTGKSHWEAALFGSIAEADISNITITDAKISNTVVGQNQMNSDWSVNPGQDEQGAAILTCFATASKITNCSVSGKISSASNHVAGLCGTSANNTIIDCSAYVEVSGTGKWNYAGLVGATKNSTIKGCYVEAKITAKTMDGTQGLFASGIGSGSSVFDSYATGTINSGFTFAQLKDAKKVSNCFSLGTTGDGKTKSGSGTFENSYIIEKGYSELLPAIKKADLNAKFTGLAAWDVSGEIPVLKRFVAPVINNSNADSNNTGATESTTTQSGGNNVVIQGSVQNEEAEQTILVNGLDVLTLIADLPDAYNIEEKDFEHYIELYKAYMAMPKANKENVTEEQDLAIKEIGEVVSKELIKSISEKVKALPTGKKLTNDNKSEVTEILRLYKLVPDEFKSDMDSDIYKKLCESAQILGVGGLTPTNSNDIVGYFTWFIIALNVVLLIGTIVFVVLLIRLYVKKRALGVDDADFQEGIEE